MGVCSNFLQDCGIAVYSAGLHEVCDALKEEHVVMVVGSYGQSRSLVVESDCLDDGHRVREDSQPWVICKSGEGCVYGHQFGSHDGAGFLASCGVDEYRGVRWDVYHCSTQSRVPFDVRTVCVDPFF
jgi:hypothetical protein